MQLASRMQPESRRTMTANRTLVCLRQRSEFGLAVILTFDLLTSECNQLIFAPNCTKVVNLVKFSQLGTKYHADKCLANDHS